MIVQVDHPLHTLKGRRGYKEIRDNVTYAEGTVGPHYFHLHNHDGRHEREGLLPTLTLYRDGLHHAELHFELTDFETGMEIIRQSVYFLDPMVCFMFAQGGPAGLAEVLGRHG